jgi:hypothetical protein
VIRIFTSSPDGAFTVLFRSNFGSQSNNVFLINLESIIGRLITNFEINSLSVLPLTDTMCFSNFFVTKGGTIPFGYVSDNLLI